MTFDQQPTGRALVRHQAQDRLSLNLDPSLRRILEEEATKRSDANGGRRPAEAELIRQLLVEGLKACGHNLNMTRIGRRDVVRHVPPPESV